MLFQPLQAALSFSQCQDLPDPTSTGQCVTIDDHLYYTGTEMDSDGTKKKKSDVYQYAVSLREWTKLPQQHQYAHFSLGQVKKELVTIGGWNYTKKKATKKIMHVGGRKWMKKGSHKMPTPRHSLVVISLPLHVIAAGGMVDQDNRHTDIVEIYHIETTEWSKVESLPNAACSFKSLGVLNDCVYIIGNRDENNRLNKMYCASLDLLLLSCKQPAALPAGDGHQAPSAWKEVIDTPMYSPSALVVCNIILAIGGYKNAECSNTELDSSIHAYSPTLNTWIRVGQLPCPLTAESAMGVLSSRELLVIGGINEENACTKTMHKGTFELSIC